MGISFFIAKSSCSISQNAVSAHIPRSFPPGFFFESHLFIQKNTKATTELQRENDQDAGWDEKTCLSEHLCRRKGGNRRRWGSS